MPIPIAHSSDNFGATKQRENHGILAKTRVWIVKNARRSVTREQKCRHKIQVIRALCGDARFQYQYPQKLAQNKILILTTSKRKKASGKIFRMPATVMSANLYLGLRFELSRL